MKAANSAGLLRLWVRPFCESLLDDAVDLAVQAVDDLGARARRQEKPDPGQVVEVLEALLVHRRHVGQGG